MHFFRNRLLAISLLCAICTLCFVLPVHADDDDEEIDPINVRAPEVGVQIPGLELSGSEIVEPDPDSPLADTYIESPFLAEYLAAVFRFGVGASVILCILVIIISGLQWTASGGNSAIIGSAKKRIAGALTGMLLAVGSYSVLYTINPNLLAFPTLRTLYVRGVNLDDLVINAKRDNHQGLTNLPKTIENTAFDDVFKAFANCPVAGRQGIDWRFLKVVAYFESARWQYVQRANSFGFTGLFQVGPDFCPSMLRKWPAWAAKCGPAKRHDPAGEQALFDPVLNTAAGFGNLSHGLEKAIQRCGGRPDPFILSMLTYLAHNSGAGAQNAIIKASSNSCSSIEGLQQAIVKYWSGKKGSQGLSPEEHGKKRAKSMTKVADLAKALGINDIFDTSHNGDAACPLSASPDQFTWSGPSGGTGDTPSSGSCPTAGPISCNSRGKKIIAVGDSMTQPSQYVEKLAQACGHTVVANKAVHSAKTGPGYGGPKSLKEQMQELANDPNINLRDVDDIIVLGGANDIMSGRAYRPNDPIPTEDNLYSIYTIAKQHGIRVIAVTMPPWKNHSGGDNWNDKAKSRLNQLNSWIKGKGSGGSGPKIDVVVDFYGKVNDNDAFCADLTKDGVHLNPQGISVLAELIAQRAY